jgi:N-acyl-D-amino-acid deacylase
MSDSGRALLLTGGDVVLDGQGVARADVLVQDGRVAAVGSDLSATDACIIDCAGAIVMPGFIDMHSHADDAVFDDGVQRALLRQGVTTVVTGQDGVSYAPGDGRYGSDYFGGLLGPARHYDGGGVGSLLRAYDGATRVNVAYLVPLGTVRHDVMGDDASAPTPEQLARMREVVAGALEEGAVGVSTGLDYVPGLFAGTAELAALAEVAARSGGVYVTHMRGGYEDNVSVGIDEAIRIGQLSGARVHISHLHADAPRVASEMERMLAAGVKPTFDAYPYRRGCTLLGMLALPPELVALGLEEAARRLGDEGLVEQLLTDWFPQVARRADLGPAWLERVTYSHVPSPVHRELEGLSLDEAGRARRMDPLRLLCRVLSDTRLHTVVIARNPRVRTDDELSAIFTSEYHTAGSDGIYQGGSPHPRGWGTFARFLSTFTRERGDYSWSQAATHLSRRGAEVLGLAGRGRIAVGAVADLAVVDPARVRDRATYAHPTRVATGIDVVVVNGRVVLDGGELTGELAGQGIRD